MSNSLKTLFLAGLLFVMGWAVFGQAVAFDFQNLDDDYYVEHNEDLDIWRTAAGIKWALTYTETGNWHPVTWLSLMLDYQLFGLEPYGYHLTNIFLHLFNGLLLFFFLKKFTGSLWRSFFVAALFLVHPLRAESVAWVAERKDVLSGFFFFLTLWFYGFYAQSQKLSRKGRARICYLFSVVSFELGMLSKYMLVTVPFLLVLLDIWPFRRISLTPERPSLREWVKRFAEKWPFFVLIIPSTVMAIVSRMGGSLDFNFKIPFMIRFLNSFAFYTAYLKKTFIPVDLSFYYPYPLEGIPIAAILASFFALALVTLLALKFVRERPYGLVGWLWFLGMLIPVIGWLHIGESVHSDRYSYLPHVGFFIALVWCGYDLLIKKMRLNQSVISLVLFLIVCVFAGFSWKQTSYWKNIYTLNEHAIRVNYQNHMAHHNLGLQLIRDSQPARALKHFETVRRIRPKDIKPMFLVGAAKHKLGRDIEALDLLVRTISRDPQHVEAFEILAEIYKNLGRPDRAIKHYLRVIELEPDNEVALYNLANLYKKLKDYVRAERYYRLTIDTNPQQFKAWNNLANILAIQKRYEEAEQVYRQVLQEKPDHERAAYNLTVLLYMTGRSAEAREVFARFLEPQAGESRFRAKAAALLGKQEIGELPTDEDVSFNLSEEDDG